MATTIDVSHEMWKEYNKSLNRLIEKPKKICI